MDKSWDYLIVTASNEAQSRAYEMQLRLRQELGLLEAVREVLVVPDPGGKRVGSGGSTLYCLIELLNRELHSPGRGSGDWRDILKELRILIVHAGGDSRRLPAYGPCGKIFVPVPGESDCCLPVTLFDRQLPVYLELPAMPPAVGQVVITSGDVLLHFDPTQVRFSEKGLTGLGCFAPPEQASNHGVYCRGQSDAVRLFLQKPSCEEQQETGAVDPYGQAVLDIGVMNLTGEFAAELLEVFGVRQGDGGEFELAGPMGRAILDYGVDFYREICCGMGSGVTCERYAESVVEAGSAWPEALIDQLFESLSGLPFYVNVLLGCEFLHFGTSQQIISSGNALVRHERGPATFNTCLGINNEIGDGGQLAGSHAWVEGCRIEAPLTLGGENVVVGVDVEEPLSLPVQMCLDVIPGRDRGGGEVWFVRCYGVKDMFNDSVEKGAAFFGRAVLEWLKAAGATAEDIWREDVSEEKRCLWNAKVFPAVKEHVQYRDWLWMSNPGRADSQQIRAWRSAERYSLAEIAVLTDQRAFHQRRIAIRSVQIRDSLRKMFNRDSEFSSAELAYILRCSGQPAVWVANLLAQARWCHNIGSGNSLDCLVFPRVIHTIGSAMLEFAEDSGIPLKEIFPSLTEQLTDGDRSWLASMGLKVDFPVTVRQWTARACALAFEALEDAIISSGGDKIAPPVSSLRSDEIVWGRAPARFDTGGGWTDTPPYSLEHGGCVVNAAVNLNGQPPIQAYLRVIEKPVIRIGSIDLGTRIEIGSLDELLDYREPQSEYGLAKAALALSGFSPETADWPQGTTLEKMLKDFGGGIELTTLAAIPKGSGLGTSSIMGAVVIAVIQRAVGRTLTQKDLFHSVLRLEQSLTTGGGWQDQIGGAVGGAKIVSTGAGLIPDARIHYLPADVLDPGINDGRTLLYYTGITRLAKNILGEVVGNYLNRDRRAMSTLRQIHTLAPRVAEAYSRKDIKLFGRLVDSAWELNKKLDPNSTNEEVEKLLSRVRPHIFGAKLLGAGGGGFLLMVCKSVEDAQRIRMMLQTEPANERSRFFEFDVNPEGLVVTVS